jgi:hypothetical protein
MPIRHSPRRRSFLALAGMVALLPAMPAAAGEIYTGLLSSTAVGGYDPVAYFTEGKPRPGLASITLEWKGATWRFASAKNRDLFRADPERYAPRYGGHCAWATARNYLAKGDPLHWRIVDGRLYLNYDAKVQSDWEKDIPGEIAKAEANWPAILNR